MGTSGHAVAMGRTNPSGVGRTEPVTRFMLTLGVVVGPFYLALGLLQAFLRDGFDLGRHALSHLATGPGGWVQTANFVLSGLMVVAAALAFTRVMGPRARAMCVLLGAFGV
ncbi:MAG: DUF998 domain-containing protein, partial [Cytophagaceae bacterium]|nr:DUF998 domain-containing protein [Gemmatimonadaceae bacterium]